MTETVLIVPRESEGRAAGMKGFDEWWQRRAKCHTNTDRDVKESWKMMRWCHQWEETTQYYTQ